MRRDICPFWICLTFEFPPSCLDYCIGSVSLFYLCARPDCSSCVMRFQYMCELDNATRVVWTCLPFGCSRPVPWMVAWRPRSLTQSTWVLDVTLGAIQPQHQSLASLFASLDTSASIALDQAQEANLSRNFSSKNTPFKPCAHSRAVGIPIVSHDVRSGHRDSLHHSGSGGCGTATVHPAVFHSHPGLGRSADCPIVGMIQRNIRDGSTLTDRQITDFLFFAFLVVGRCWLLIDDRIGRNMS